MTIAEVTLPSALLAPMTGREVFLMRRAADWTQQQMADLLEVSKRTYERIERDEGGRTFSKPEQLMLMLWWKRLVESGLSFRLMNDPVRDQWYVESAFGGRSWKGLGPYESRADAMHILRTLDRLKA